MFITLGAYKTSILGFADLGILGNSTTVFRVEQEPADFRRQLASTGSGRLEK
jgi:hypothetical protein